MKSLQQARLGSGMSIIHVYVN